MWAILGGLVLDPLFLDCERYFKITHLKMLACGGVIYRYKKTTHFVLLLLN